ncbi:MAG: bifunctional phosphoribosylaminoimidazolecarboxamide formyltransferase/IMP cyclohydrolase [bacterium]
MVKRAILSVSDKTGLKEFATGLVSMDVELLSTGGTAKFLRDAGLKVTDVSEVTGFPEMMEGRVKTLHPRIHGGILADRRKPEHMEAIKAQNIEPIDLIVVNLYPFAQTISKPDVTLDDAIENIDIGGPSLVRAAAKNFQSVAVVVDPADYDVILEELKSSKQVSYELRSRLMAKAFSHTAAYDALIANYFNNQFDPEYPFPSTLTLSYKREQTMRYGENPHQKAAFYSDAIQKEAGIGSAKQLWGKELSHNNLLDADAALELVREFSEPTVAIIKHTNPCGCATASAIPEAFLKAKAADPTSAFGGIIASNRPIDASAAEVILEKGNFFEVIIAPDFTDEAFKMITKRKGWGLDVRLMKVGEFGPSQSGFALKSLNGGILYQSRDLEQLNTDTLQCVTERQPSEEDKTDLAFAWAIVKHVKSNAIVLVKNRQLIGVGAGQMNRVRSVRLALEQAGDEVTGSVMASDAFFPFPDSIETAGSAGVKAVIQPGGSKKDVDAIQSCNQTGMAMLFTGIRHFRH